MMDEKDITNAATLIARAVYNGVAPDSPQWAKCMDAATMLSGRMVIKPNVMRDAREAIAECKTFNEKFPIGTKGTLQVGGNTVATVLEQAAMVFPHQAFGCEILAWFEGIGWKDVRTFVLAPETLTESNELLHVSIQIKQQNRPGLACWVAKAAALADPSNFNAHNEVGILLAQQGRYAEAIVAYDTALALKPNSGETHNNRAMSLRAVGRSQEAVTDAGEALRLMPGNGLVKLNAAAIYDDCGRVDLAAALVSEHIAQSPDDPNTHYNYGLMLLAAERFADGWREFAWRVKQKPINAHYDHFDVDRYEDGMDVAGKRVLVWPEQGLGDEVLMATMLPDLIAEGAQITLLAAPRLIPLFKRAFPTIDVQPRVALPIGALFQREIIPQADLPIRIDRETFDVQMSLGDLGARYRSSTDKFPRQERLLVPDTSPVQLARSKGLKVVGLTWHSRRNPRIGALKSLDLEEMVPILRTPNCVFVNLQYGDCADEIGRVKEQFGVHIVQLPEIDPLIDMNIYTNFIATLDLVITASNTAAHIAGGLGVPTWVLVPEGPGKLWYWHRDRNDSPWYASVELFRQGIGLDWSVPINAIKQRLEQLCSS